jgi:DNA-binding response OmpR family regulator
MSSKNQAKKILIVEDEPATRKSLAAALKKAGFQILTANDGEAGLALAFKEHPNLILLDLLMPKKDGLEVLKELRQDDWGEDVPVIILTNLSSAEYVAETIQYGVFDHLVKSDWDVGDVVKKVKAKLN